MPIFGGTKEPRYEGAVLCDREENGYHDSDFYAIVWKDDEGCCGNVYYNTTRFPGGGSCTVDATDEVKAKANDWIEAWAFRMLSSKADAEAARVEMGKMVRVVSGRKVKVGTEGKVGGQAEVRGVSGTDRKSTRLNSSH